MVNRRSSMYFTLPNELTGGEKSKEAKMNVSISMVLPKAMEKKSSKFIDDQMEELSKSFKKFMKKQIEKLMEDD